MADDKTAGDEKRSGSGKGKGGPKTVGDGKIEVTLAHPLSKERARTQLGIQTDEDLRVGTLLKIGREQARSLINAGYAKDVDPDDPTQTARALGLNVGPSPAQATDAQPQS